MPSFYFPTCRCLLRQILEYFSQYVNNKGVNDIHDFDLPFFNDVGLWVKTLSFRWPQRRNHMAINYCCEKVTGFLKWFVYQKILEKSIVGVAVCIVCAILLKAVEPVFSIQIRNKTLNNFLTASNINCYFKKELSNNFFFVKILLQMPIFSRCWPLSTNSWGFSEHQGNNFES